MQRNAAQPIPGSGGILRLPPEVQQLGGLLRHRLASETRDGRVWGQSCRRAGTARAGDCKTFSSRREENSSCRHELHRQRRRSCWPGSEGATAPAFAMRLQHDGRCPEGRTAIGVQTVSSATPSNF